MCDNGVEAHLAKESFLRFGDGHEPLIRKGGVYFVKARERTSAQKIDEYEMTGAQKIDEYEMTGAQKKKTDADKPMDSQKIDECEMTGAQKKKIDAYEPMDS